MTGTSLRSWQDFFALGTFLVAGPPRESTRVEEAARENSEIDLNTHSSRGSAAKTIALPR